MMLKQFLLTSFLILFFLSNGLTQPKGTCGMSLEDLTLVRQSLIENKAYLKNHPPVASDRSAITYIPVKYHLVAENDGTNRIQYNKILDQICLLNETFQDLEVQFYIYEGFNNLDNTEVYQNHSFTIGALKMQQEQERNALNVWVLENAQLSDDAVNTTLGYYSPTLDWVVVRKDFTSGQGYTMLHEMGHFFSLLHPFHGWGDEGAAPYDASYSGNPAPVRSPEPANILNELADGSNCEIAGDMICDTPADYLYFEEMDDSQCRYNKSMLDPKGEALNPDPTLIMGYFIDACMDKFTPQQVEVMVADLQSERRTRLRSNYIPQGGIINDAPILTSPIERAVTSNYNKVQLKWNAVTNATNYLVEIDRVPTFGNSTIQLLTSTNSVTVDSQLDPDKNYFWRVRPYNEVQTCVAPSRSDRFRTGLMTATSTIERVDNWEVYPNPIKATEGLTISVESNEAFEAAVKLFSVTGQLIFSQEEQYFQEGVTQYSISTAILTPGIYFIHLESEEGILNKRVVKMSK